MIKTDDRNAYSHTVRRVWLDESRAIFQYTHFGQFYWAHSDYGCWNVLFRNWKKEKINKKYDILLVKNSFMKGKSKGLRQMGLFEHFHRAQIYMHEIDKKKSESFIGMHVFHLEGDHISKTITPNRPIFIAAQKKEA